MIDFSIVNMAHIILRLLEYVDGISEHKNADKEHKTKGSDILNDLSKERYEESKARE